VGRHNRHVSVHHAVDALLGEGKVLLRVLVALVVEENAAQAPGFAAVLDVEVFVRPLLELGVVFGVVLFVGGATAPPKNVFLQGEARSKRN